MTTLSDIARWKQTAAEKKAAHIIVVCDTFDWSDYPVYVSKGESLDDIKARCASQPMSKIMEVITLN